MDLEHWLRALFRRIDADGVRGIEAELHEDVRFRFGSFPAGEGRETFAELWAGMAPAIRSLHHELAEWWQVGERVLCRGTVSYGLPDGSEASFPFMNLFGMRDGRIAEYLIYVDASPVFGVPPLA